MLQVAFFGGLSNAFWVGCSHPGERGDRASHSIFYLSSIAMKTSKNEKKREKAAV